LNFRQKVVETYKAGGISQRDLAVRFRISLFFIVNFCVSGVGVINLDVSDNSDLLKPNEFSQSFSPLFSTLTKQNEESKRKNEN